MRSERPAVPRARRVAACHRPRCPRQGAVPLPRSGGGLHEAAAPARADRAHENAGAGWRDWFAGQQWPVHKTSLGGWSQDRYQRSVEETWAENAKALAAEVTAAAGRIGARHVIVSGDIRARSLLLEHLATPLRESAAVLDEEVGADSPAMADAADRAEACGGIARPRDGVGATLRFSLAGS